MSPRKPNVAATFALPQVDLAGSVDRQLTCAHQQQKNWCWAACIQMILSATRSAEQWEIVNRGLGRTDCQVNAGSSECNRVLRMSGSAPSVLSALNANSLNGTFVDGTLDAGTLCRRLEDAPALVSFDGPSGGHVVLVVESRDSGDAGNPNLLVCNPGRDPCGEEWYSYRRLFRGLEPGLGQWSETIHSIT
ncbi:MAG: hypothetical protein ACYC3L_13500 [Gemmatimonadaceae bacterium]